MKENTPDLVKLMKQEYEQIPVPDELSFRVRTAIARAKREKKEKYVMRISKIAKTLGATAAAFMLTVVALANSSQNIAQAMEQLPVLGAITKVVTFRTYEDERGNVSAHVDVPQIEGGDEVRAVNDAIESYTDTIIARYEADAAIMGDEGHYDLNVSHTVVTDNERLFAIRFDETLVMNSGNESVMIYNVDKSTGSILTLADLFLPDSDYIAVLTENIKAQMEARMDADESVHYWLHDEIEAMNFKELSPDTAFYVNENGELVIVFNEGDVAPMYMGVVEFAIPAEVTAAIAQPGLLK